VFEFITETVVYTAVTAAETQTSYSIVKYFQISNQKYIVCNYSRRRLMGSLWDRDKLIPITD
jgi:hypothetical protein